MLHLDLTFLMVLCLGQVKEMDYILIFSLARIKMHGNAYGAMHKRAVRHMVMIYHSLLPSAHSPASKQIRMPGLQRPRPAILLLLILLSFLMVIRSSLLRLTSSPILVSISLSLLVLLVVASLLGVRRLCKAILCLRIPSIPLRVMLVSL